MKNILSKLTLILLTSFTCVNGMDSNRIASSSSSTTQERIAEQNGQILQPNQPQVDQKEKKEFEEQNDSSNLINDDCSKH